MSRRSAQRENERWLASWKRQKAGVPSLRPYQEYRDIPYADKWTPQLRRYIRQRDNYTCQLCKSKLPGYSLPVHHINYIKSDCRESNLITLCHPCHNRTSFANERRNWFEVLSRYMKETTHFLKE